MSAWNISANAIRNPIAPIVLFLALLFAGLTAYFRLPINQLPNVETPLFTVTAAQAGASPSELETQVTQRIEAALTGVSGVKRIMSEVQQGVSVTSVELQLGADLGRAIDDARDAMTRVRSELPADMEEPLIERIDFAADPLGYFALVWPGKTEQQLSWFIDNELNRALLAVKGVSAVQRLGGVDREIRVELDPERLVAVGLTADNVSQQLRAINADLPGGQAQVGGQAQSIRTLGAARTVEGLADTRIQTPTGQSVKLTDLGVVRDGASDITTVARYDGQPVVSFLVQRAKGSSEVKVYDAMQARMKQVEADNPGLKLQLLGTPVTFIKGMHKSSIAALLEGALLAIIVVFLILRDWRATSIAAVAIPLATIPTFAAMEPLGFTLNMMTLIALGLVAGVLVDDAIVEIENIVRHIRMGKNPYQAALEAADEIGLAVVATSATIIVVFLPVSFMSGQIGQFFKEFGITVAVAVFFSLLVARLITPLMAAYFLKGGHDERPAGWMTNAYEKCLAWAIRRPLAAAGMGLATFAVSLTPVFTGMIPMQMLPRMDNGTISMAVEFAPGTPLAGADQTMRALAQRIEEEPDVQGVFTSLSGPGGAARSGNVYVQLTEKHGLFHFGPPGRTRDAFAVEQGLRKRLTDIAGVRITFLQFQGGGRGSDITLEFVGDNPVALKAASDQLVAEMKTLSMLSDIKSTAAMQRPEIQIRPRPEEAARLGVRSADLAAAVRVATAGDVDQNLAKYTLPDRQIPIRVALRTDARTDIEAIKALRVRTQTGEAVRLDSVADVSFSVGEAMIERRDRQRKIAVSANVVSGPLGRGVEAVMALPVVKQPPAGVKLLAAGDTEQQVEMVESFGTALLWGIILIYAVMVLLFKDFFQPITIMAALPLSVGGAFVGLLLANQPLSLFVFIGFLMLMGIVTKNSILLVDFAIERMREGVSRNAALMEAGMKRARPIVMTTIAMSAGMLPAAAGWHVDGSLRQGMGVAVIGGLILSTMLSLIVVPAVFILIDRLERLVKPLFGRVLTEEAKHVRAADEAVRQPAE
jgi:hydrophobic/amphiphilic exporter-1 (mainly G- bacteria), HAE1 family